MVKVFFDLLSHMFGQHSQIASKVSGHLQMILNVVLAAVCIGYLTNLLYPALPMFLALGISVGCLLCALPFEQINIDVQTSPGLPKSSAKDANSVETWKSWWMLISSLMGSLQYAIRNFNLLRNFAMSAMGLKMIMGLQYLGFSVMVVDIAIIGGIIGLCSHFLLSYFSWDKYYAGSGQNDVLKMAMDNVWMMVLLMPVYLAVSMVSGSALLGGLTVCSLYYEFNVGTFTSRFTADRSVPRKKDVKEGLFLKTAIITLPIGSFLYGLVDFSNSAVILSQMKLLNPYTLGLCVGFGLLSWSNTMLIWGYNVVRKKAEINRESVKPDLFVKLFYADYAVRRLSIYAKEAGLLLLDLMNNHLTLRFVSSITLLMFGLPMNIVFLHACTVAFMCNKLTILYFQSTGSHEPVASNAHKGTAAARISRTVLAMFDSEVDWSKRYGNKYQSMGPKIA